MFFQRVFSLVKRYKEALSILASIGAVLLSIYTYVVTNLWNVHDVEVYVRANIANDDESNPIQVILVNQGKRTETILEATMAIRRPLRNGNT
jgi:hypothetical protein